MPRMASLLDTFRGRLIYKISIPVAFILFASIFLWSFYHLKYQRNSTIESLTTGAERVSNTIKLGLHYAMMLNSRDDIQAIVNNLSKLQEIRGVRIINKRGEVMFTSNPGQAHTVIPQRDMLCQTCHAYRPPLLAPSQGDAIYKDSVENGERVLRLVSPIQNEPGCSNNAACHDHRPEEKILGVLDLGFSLAEADTLMGESRQHTFYLAFIQFVVTFITLSLLFFVLIKRPINSIIRDARQLSTGKSIRRREHSPDEIGQLAQAIFGMGEELISKNNQISLQKNLYQDLFEGVPCIITVQDRDFRLLRFNKAFEDRFQARIGEFCYKAYKNRDSKCPDCPVEKTFITGLFHTTEESGCYRDGSKAHWIVNTAPIYDSEGNLVAAMEMCLDITERKELESEVKRSEKKYVDIFNNIPSAVFVLDQADFSIRDCNRSAVHIYGWEKSELTSMSFLDLFAAVEKQALIKAMKKGLDIDQAKHITKTGREFFVSVRTTHSEFNKRKVYLVAVSDISKRLETEQQLIQASKMATLGEMATGVAHEINQPLAVIQTSVDLIKRSLNRGSLPDEALLRRVTELVVAQVDRATKIIGHMREFGRKSEAHLDEVDLNTVLRRSFDFFSQQLALRTIDVAWELDEKLPAVRCEPNRMEQVFINFLINARDAIEDRAAREGRESPRRITLKTMHNQDYVTVRISDTGTGVPETLYTRIFEPFFTTKQVGKGTGLGLSISYGIVKEYGGAINVVNNEDGGASFFIRLPVAGDRAGGGE
ncbi:Sporulation kinase E [Fundidesulfovibrio magnetotacticus]|uniref:histidine kinase n=1 Tax=Fundidesulfovibrio magnetotacticus TaxID=2730080 RepID=A0A6V8LVS6_9BACT|nr:PAS domain S-box protein [Fundidesulfovibrio magnetotacticus]GFK92355.1 Sporulation kinase E [Fundidesulfovibrio magnetotacticus]